MIRLIDVLFMERVRSGGCCLAFYADDEDVCFALLCSQEQVRELLDRCTAPDQRTIVEDFRERLLQSPLPVRSSVSGRRFGGEMARFLCEMRRVVEKATRTRMLMVDSSDRLRVQCSPGTICEAVGVVHAIDDTGWFVHVVFSREQARHVLARYVDLCPDEAAHRDAVVETSCLPQKSACAPILFEGEVAQALGFTLEGYWQLQNVFEPTPRLEQ